MKFCEICNNMYYIGIDPDDTYKLTYYCRNCKHVDDTITEEGVCVMKTQLKKGDHEFNHTFNEYTKLDPTLPRLYNTKCPNSECKTEHGVIYIRYDNDNLKYLYICADCDVKWKTDDRK